MIEEKKLDKRKWEKPELKIFDINKTYGGPIEHSTIEDISYNTPS